MRDLFNLDFIKFPPIILPLAQAILPHLLIIVELLIVVVPVLVGVAFLTLIERKVLAAMQKRVGPNVVGFLGILQPIADAAKLILKEFVLPFSSNKFIFVVSSLVSLALSLSSWSVIPMQYNSVFADINLSLILIFAISSLNVYGIIMAGWSSNSRYAFLGSLRSASQMVSYEVSIGLVVMNVVLCVGSLNIHQIVVFQEHVWFIVPLFPVFVLFFVSAVAETNRAPFDLPEAEGELVAGYNVEYSAASFALFFIAEYANILLMSTLSVLFFFGGWLAPSTYYLGLLDFFIVPWYLLPFFEFSFLPDFFWLFLKISAVVFAFIWIRATFPRYRYDQLMRLGWKVILPWSLASVVFTVAILLAFDAFPS